jgi:hypothetical protein
MAETELHMEEMIDTIQVLQDFFADRPDVYVWGNLLLYYEEENPRKHVSPDVLVAFGVPKEPKRNYYLVWKEGTAPDLVVEIPVRPAGRIPRPSPSGLPAGERGIHAYRPDRRPVAQPALGSSTRARRRPASPVDSVAGARLLTRSERAELADRHAQEERRRAEQERKLADAERERAAAERERAEAERERAEAAVAAEHQLAQENERLRREIEALRRG